MTKECAPVLAAAVSIGWRRASPYEGGYRISRHVTRAPRQRLQWPMLYHGSNDNIRVAAAQSSKSANVEPLTQDGGALKNGDTPKPGVSPAHPSLGHAVLEIVKHVVAATAAFLVIFAIAIALDLLAKLLLKQEILEKDSTLYFTLVGVKYALLFVDVALLTVFLLKFSWRAARSF